MIFFFFLSHMGLCCFYLLSFFFQYLVELVSKEMRVSDKAASVSTLELRKQMENKHVAFQGSFQSQV